MKNICQLYHTIPISARGNGKRRMKQKAKPVQIEHNNIFNGKHGDGNRGKTERIGKMSEYVNVVEIFGENVFNDAVMQARLPKKVYKELKQTMERMIVFGSLQMED